MPRVLEPEVMTDPVECLAYADFDKSPMISVFKESLSTAFPNIDGSLIADIGSGSGDYYPTLCNAYPNSTFVGYEASSEMLAIANQRVSNPQVSFQQKFIPTDALPAQTYDGVISTMFLHQLPDPMVFWDALKQTAKANAFFMMLDLLRVEDDAACDAIVNAYVAPDQTVFAQEFKDSLKAAFIVEELEQQLLNVGIQATIEVKNLPNNFNIVIIYGRV